MIVRTAPDGRPPLRPRLLRRAGSFHLTTQESSIPGARRTTSMSDVVHDIVRLRSSSLLPPVTFTHLINKFIRDDDRTVLVLGTG